eukprot:CAMPEP_0177189732 /NCGR_PEP_ID=MMETSP0367-20130122/20430_1 /TAXON_ID=447022 ORGANISM="Scrippsiella hangoei-like, Strain SHHI-4" /NCGR_SAMPLE_ID=MMETSP0367 /ASSEMBLY_ACC=CAM_ASM_000362 /LENGTH=67 /DNA_ID=CAMNT_0018637299 /DNA_START=15 /DNA_END=218 /DNA_ORIENTATION=+
MARESTATEVTMPPLVAELITVLPPATGTAASFNVRSTETQPAASPQYMRHVVEVGNILAAVASRRA